MAQGRAISLLTRTVCENILSTIENRKKNQNLDSNLSSKFKSKIKIKILDLDSNFRFEI